ncbi:p53 apoptosis effector related to PMP-22 [Aplysia californica]|uniref:P53 apoptosis effector related to PMP-22 n=1 Tax=Aplysia californica TaxID=6500 RepID=A0ABM1AEM1_APLCA|nr:p53 apoptosis effector related to PMP-22 [Aplysia californica]
MGDFHKIRPFKILAVVMATVAVVLTVISLAGPDWVSVKFYEGKLQKSWGLWWECWRVHVSFEMCVGADWLAGCAAMVFLALIADAIATIMGLWGLFVKRRLPYVLAGVLCIIAAMFHIISLIIYPVKFTAEVTGNDDNKAETAQFVFDWTYGIAWGAVIFLVGATVFFFIRVRDEDNAQPMKVMADKPTVYYQP